MPLCPPTVLLRGVSGTQLYNMGSATLDLTFRDRTVRHTFVVVDGISRPLILGQDFFRKHNGILDFGRGTFDFDEENSPAEAVTFQATQLPPNSRTLLSVFVKSPTNSAGVLFPADIPEMPFLTTPVCLVQPEQNVAVCEILNVSDSPVCLDSESTVAYFTALSSQDSVSSPIEQHSPHSPQIATLTVDDPPLGPSTTDTERDEFMRIAKDLDIQFGSSDLTASQQNDLLALLGKNRDCFAKDLAELKPARIPGLEIDTGSEPPVRKTAYRASPPVMREIETQLKAMLDNEIIHTQACTYERMHTHKHACTNACTHTQTHT